MHGIDYPFKIPYRGCFRKLAPSRRPVYRSICSLSIVIRKLDTASRRRTTRSRSGSSSRKIASSPAKGPSPIPILSPGFQFAGGRTSGSSLLRDFLRILGKRLSNPASISRVKTLLSLRGFVLTRYHFGSTLGPPVAGSDRLYGSGHLPEISDGPYQAFADRNLGFPTQFFLREGDIRLPPDRVVLRKGPEDDLRGGSGDLPDHHRQVLDAVFARVPQVHRSHDLVLVHHRDQPRDQVVHVAEGTGLVPRSVDRDRFVAEGLEDKIGNDPSVVGVHPGAEGVEDPNHADPQLVLAVVVEKERLGAPFPLIVAVTAKGSPPVAAHADDVVLDVHAVDLARVAKPFRLHQLRLDRRPEVDAVDVATGSE